MPEGGLDKLGLGNYRKLGYFRPNKVSRYVTLNSRRINPV